MTDRPSLPPAALEALADAALEAAPQALVIADTEGRPWRLNRRARRLLELSDADAAAWSGRLPGSGAERGGGWRDLPLGGGGTAPFWVWSRPLPLPPAAGGEVGAGGAVLHALWPCRVTEDQAHASGGDEGGFDEMMAVLARHALLGEMGGALAHQMSQPLNIIRLTAERAALEAEVGDVGAGVAPTADRFARLADQAEALFGTVALVQGAPAVAGPADLEPVDLGAIMSQAANLARGPLRAAGLRPEVVTPAELPRAWGEPVLLLQIGFAVLTVLAEAVGGEAAERAQARGAAVRRGGPAAGPVGAVVVRVDPEAGAAAGDSRLIVDMVRDETLTRGTPLVPVAPDLTLSRRVVLAALALAGLGGHLMMLVDDQGALRGVRLDLARVTGRRAADAGASPGGGTDAAGEAVDDDRPVRVLLAEDEVEAATEIAEFLRDQECEVTVAGDVPTAVAALDAAQHDVLITDVSMPGGGARVLLRAAEAAHPDMAVILASGFAIEGDASLADLADMADAILRKPFGLSELRAALDRVLEADGAG